MLSTHSQDNLEIENEIKISDTFIFKRKNKLGSGSFGEIYKGMNIKTGEDVAVKFESNKCKTPQLNYESKILKLLQGGGNFFNNFSVGIPNLYNISIHDKNTIMVIEILHKNLEELKTENTNNKFSLKTVLMIADQIVI